MNKVYVCLIALLALFFNSCGNQDSYEALYVNPNVNYIYADQTVDSITIQSSHNWTVEAITPWCTINPTDAKGMIESGYLLTTKTIPFYTEVNTSREIRTAQIVVNNTQFKVDHYIRQAYWLNITSPQMINKDSQTYTDVEFVASVGNNVTSYDIEFTIYADNATMSVDAPWVELSKKSFTKGKNTCTLTFSINPSASERKATITLRTNNGISTPILLIQRAI